MESIIKYLRAAPEGQKLWIANKNSPCILLGFEQTDGDIKILVSDDGVCLKFNSDGTYKDSDEQLLLPSPYNLRWDNNWRWNPEDCKRGDIVVSPECGCIFMSNGNLYKNRYFHRNLKICALAVYCLDNDNFQPLEGAIDPTEKLSENRWTDSPTFPANEKEKHIFFEAMEKARFDFDFKTLMFKRI